MRFSTLQKTLFVITLMFFTISSSYSQSLLQQNPSPQIEEMANRKVEKWKDELSLTTKQEDLMEKKIIEFAMKRERLLQSKMREDAKTERLLRLQTLENKDMRDILTKPQFERYLLLLERQGNDLN
jgi:hypothetical protein